MAGKWSGGGGGLLAPWHGGGSSMGWKWEFHGVEVAERRNLSAQGAAGFATFGGGFWGAGNDPFEDGK